MRPIFLVALLVAIAAACVSTALASESDPWPKGEADKLEAFCNRIGEAADFDSGAYCACFASEASKQINWSDFLLAQEIYRETGDDSPLYILVGPVRAKCDPLNPKKKGEGVEF